MKRKINQEKKKACKYAYSVTYSNIHNKELFFLTFRGNEDWGILWATKKKAKEDETESTAVTFPQARGSGTCQADPTVQTPAFKVAMEGRGGE